MLFTVSEQFHAGRNESDEQRTKATVKFCFIF